MDKQKLNVRKLMLLSPDYYSRLRNSHSPFPRQPLKIEKKLLRILHNQGLSTDARLNLYNTLFTSEFRNRNLATQFRNKTGTGTQTTFPLAASTQTSIPKVMSTQTSAADDTVFSPKTSSSANVTQSSPANEAFIKSIINEDDENDLDASEPSNQANFLNQPNPSNQFFDSNLYNNLPSLNNTQYGPDMSLAFQEFVNNIRRESGRHDIDLNNLSVRGLDDSTRDYAIVNNKENNEVLTVEKPTISVTGQTATGQMKKPSPKRTRSGKVRLSNPPQRRKPYDSNKPSMSAETSSGMSTGDFMKQWESYEQNVRKKFK